MTGCLVLRYDGVSVEPLVLNGAFAVCRQGIRAAENPAPLRKLHCHAFVEQGQMHAVQSIMGHDNVMDQLSP